MPKHKDLKRVVRRRMSETGATYAAALAQLRDERVHVLDDLVHALADKHRRLEAMRQLVGGVTATELRKIDTVPEDVFAALLRGLRDPRPPIRFWCVQILDHVADERGLAAVSELLDDPVDRVRRNAVHALGCVACKPNLTTGLSDELLERLAHIAATDLSPKVRREATYTLACRQPGNTTEPNRS